MSVSFDAVAVLVGFGAGVVTLASALAGFWAWRERRKIRRFHQLMTPILNDLQNGLGTRLEDRDKRYLVRECVKLASLATFRRRRPYPDPLSATYANQELTCRFCGFAIRTDATGSCQDCGLGCRHWLPTEADRAT